MELLEPLGLELNSATHSFMPLASSISVSNEKRNRDFHNMDHRDNAQAIEKAEFHQNQNHVQNGFESKSVGAPRTSHSSLLYHPTQGAASPGKRKIPAMEQMADHVMTPRTMQPPSKKRRLSEDQRLAKITDAMATILDCIEEDDPNREGLKKTPQRYAKALLDLTRGYQQNASDLVGDAEFAECHNEMVLVRNIDIFSLCEHHLIPFHGQCHVAYIPTGSVVGLSKIARIADMYSRRFQIQERLTSQIADAVEEATNAKGVMVSVTCSHMCMAMRGVQKANTVTCTTASRGQYVVDAALRQEFLSIVNSSPFSRK